MRADAAQLTIGSNVPAYVDGDSPSASWNATSSTGYAWNAW